MLDATRAPPNTHRHVHTHTDPHMPAHILACFIVVVQLPSRVQHVMIPWTVAVRQVSLSFTISGVCPNSCPFSWWCHLTISSSDALFSSCLQSFPASGTFPVSHLFASDDQNTGASASASVLPVNIQVWSSLKINWFDLAVQGTFRSLLQCHSSKASVLWHSAFTVQLSQLYVTTGKTIAFNIQTFVGRVVSLLSISITHLRAYGCSWLLFLSAPFVNYFHKNIHCDFNPKLQQIFRAITHGGAT